MAGAVTPRSSNINLANISFEHSHSTGISAIEAIPVKIQGFVFTDVVARDRRQPDFSLL